MVQINLLPITVKKERKAKIEVRLKLKPLLFILTGLIFSILVVWTILGMRLSTQEKKLSQFEEQLKSLGTILQKLDTLKQDKEKLTYKLEFINQNIKREILWAKNLNRLSDLIPDGIWLKNIVLYTQKGEHAERYEKLDITASAVSLQGQEMIDLIGRFMTALKKDELFSQQFSEIELVSSKRSKAGNIEIMDFKLFCQFR